MDATEEQLQEIGRMIISKIMPWWENDFVNVAEIGQVEKQRITTYGLKCIGTVLHTIVKKTPDYQFFFLHPIK